MLFVYNKVETNSLYKGNLLLSNCLYFLFRTVLLILILFQSPLFSRETYVFSDSIKIYSIETTSLKNVPISRYLSKKPYSIKKESLYHYLDSLGFFNPYEDSLSSDTIRISPGPQSKIDTILISSSFPIAIDSIRKIRFPILYNAGTLQLLAKETLYFVASRGHPYAKLSISIKNAKSIQDSIVNRPSDSTQPCFNVTFHLEQKQKCVFDTPLFSGKLQTKETVLTQDIIFQKGQVFDIRLIETSQKRLMTHSYISGVQVAYPGILTDTIELEIKNDRRKRKEIRKIEIPDSVELVTIPFIIQDNSGMGIDGVIAYNSNTDLKSSTWAGLSGLLNISMLNIFHQGESVTLFYLGEEKFQQFDMAIQYPYPFRLPILCEASFGLEIEEAHYGSLKGEFEILTKLKGLWQIGAAIKGHETTLTDSTANESSWGYYGIDLILERLGEPLKLQTLSRQLLLRSGTGIANRIDGIYNRWHVIFSIGIHIPTFRNQAFLGRFTAQTIIKNNNDSLHKTEKFRVGGHNSIRGYAENEYPFSSAAYFQAEYHRYFNETGSVFIFIDAGAGFSNHITLNSHDSDELFGFGVGIGIPVKIGRLSLAWAKNYRELKGIGRIHIRISNSLSAGK